MSTKLTIKPWYFAEIWCREAAALVNILSATPSIESVFQVLTKTHRSKFANVKQNWIENPLDPAEWLDRILKIDLIVELVDRNGKRIKVAIDVTLNDRLIEKKMEEIQQPNFRQARKELGIDRHWIIVLPSHFDKISAHTLLSLFQSEANTINKRAVINLK